MTLHRDVTWTRSKSIATQLVVRAEKCVFLLNYVKMPLITTAFRLWLLVH